MSHGFLDMNVYTNKPELLKYSVFFFFFEGLEIKVNCEGNTAYFITSSAY